jgi:hypothetical protein
MLRKQVMSDDEHGDGVGDAITIGYQREKMTITSVYVTNVGSGRLRVRKGEKDDRASKSD